MNTDPIIVHQESRGWGFQAIWTFDPDTGLLENSTFLGALVETVDITTEAQNTMIGGLQIPNAEPAQAIDVRTLSHFGDAVYNLRTTDLDGDQELDPGEAVLGVRGQPNGDGQEVQMLFTNTETGWKLSHTSD